MKLNDWMIIKSSPRTPVHRRVGRIAPGSLFTAAALLFTGPVAAQDITGSWHFTGLAFAADTGPFSIDSASGAASGTLTITGDIGSGFTLTPGGAGWLTFEEAAGPVPFVQNGNRFTFSEEIGDESNLATLQWINDDTALIHTVSGNGDETLSSIDGFAGVLTRDTLPVADPAKWTGSFSGFELYAGTGEEGMVFESPAFTITDGAEPDSYLVNNNEDPAELFSLSPDDQSLTLLELSGTRRDQSLIVQLADGTLAYAFFTLENNGTAITFADVGTGIASAIPEPAAGALFAGLGAALAVTGRSRRRNRS